MDRYSLADLARHTNCTRFRVRDMDNYEDSFMIAITSYTQGVPMMFTGIKLGGNGFGRQTYGGREKRYALLSCPAECDFWIGLGETQAAFQAKRAYKVAGL